MALESTVERSETAHTERCEGAKERIAAEAIRLFCEKGYEATAVREIVDAAGVTKPVLYYYFKNKEDLFKRVMEGIFAKHFERLGRLCSDEYPDFRSQLEAIEDLYIGRARLEPTVVRFVNSMAFSGLYDHVVDFLSAWRGQFDLIVGVFERAQREGAIRSDLPPRTMAFHFIGNVVSVMRCIAHFPDVIEDDPFEHGDVRIFLEGVSPNGASDAKQSTDKEHDDAK
jgi:AcrR family transcriptional regulator